MTSQWMHWINSPRHFQTGIFCKAERKLKWSYGKSTTLIQITCNEDTGHILSIRSSQNPAFCTVFVICYHIDMRSFLEMSSRCRYCESQFFFLGKLSLIRRQELDGVKKKSEAMARELLTKEIFANMSISEVPEQIQPYSKVISFFSFFCDGTFALGWKCVKRVANGLFKRHLFIYLFIWKLGWADTLAADNGSD